jgi:hypothetical protein
VLFENLRIDVSETGAVQSWQTFRGNEWNNKGEVRGSGDAGDGIAVLQVRAIAKKEYYQLRPSCEHDAIQSINGTMLIYGLVSVMSLFKNPMILIAVVTLGMVIGVPYMMENSKWYPFTARTLLIRLLSGSRNEGRVRGNAKEKPRHDC